MLKLSSYQIITTTGTIIQCGFTITDAVLKCAPGTVLSVTGQTETPNMKPSLLKLTKTSDAHHNAVNGTDDYAQLVYADMHGSDMPSETQVFVRLVAHMETTLRIMAPGISLNAFLDHYVVPAYYKQYASDDLMEEVLWTVFERPGSNYPDGPND